MAKMSKGCGSGKMCVETDGDEDDMNSPKISSDAITPAESEDDEPEEPDEDGEKFPVIVDGEEREVSLKEALAGYVRTATFHKRMEDLNAIQGNMELDAGKLQEGWKSMARGD